MLGSDTDKDRRKKRLAPSSSPPPSSPTRRGRGSIKKFDRGTKGSSTRQLWSPSSSGLPRSSHLKTQTLGQRTRPLPHAEVAWHEMEGPRPEAEVEAADLYTEDPSVSQLIRQPETRPISQEQLVAEVKAIYAGLVMVESKCIEVDNPQSVPQKLSNEQMQAQIAIHQGLHHPRPEVFRASQHPSAGPALRRPAPQRLASKYPVSARMRPHETLAQLNEQLRNRPTYQELPLADSVDKQCYVAGTVNGAAVEAFPDTGADGCLISSKLASRLGLLPIPGTQREIALANKKVVKSPGMVKVPWEFAKEREIYTITCWILPRCIHDFVLGNNFLQATETLEKFRSRIKFRLLGALKRFSLSFLGGEKQRLRGYLNGHLTAALPDTGSDAMFLNDAYARKIGLDVDSDVRNLVEVELADGSIIMTSGIVRDAHWKVGKTTVQCNFYVLEDLCVDIILSNSYLFDMNIFSEQEEHFFDIHSEDPFKDYLLHFCNIRLVKKKRVDSHSTFHPEMTQQELEQLEKREKLDELHRRHEERNRIMALPEDEQEKGDKDEKARQQCWEALRKKRKAEWAAGSHTAKGSVPNGANLISWLKKRAHIGVPSSNRSS